MLKNFTMKGYQTLKWLHHHNAFLPLLHYIFQYISHIFCFILKLGISVSTVSVYLLLMLLWGISTPPPSFLPLPRILACTLVLAVTPTSHHPSVHGNLYTPKDLSYVLGYSMSNMKGHIIHKCPHTAQPLKHPSTGTHREQPTHLELFIYPGGNNTGSMNVGQLKERWKAQCFWLIVTWAWLCTQHAAHLSAGDSLSLPWMCLSSPCQMPNAVTD